MATTETAREKALVNYRKKLLEHRELDARLKDSMFYTVLLPFSPIDQSKSKFRRSIDIKGCQILQNKRYRNLDMSPIYFFCLDCVFE